MKNKQIYVRAKPKSIKIIENYYFEQEISRNPSIRTGQKPEGDMDIMIPYDGYKFFTRQAQDDVKKQLKEANDSKIDAIMGHLAIAEQTQTNLQNIPELNERHRTIGLRIPVWGSGIDNIDELVDDKHSTIIKYKYFPKWPDIVPVTVEMKLYDEEELIPPSDDLNKEQLNNVANQITQDIMFQPSLVAKFRFEIKFPNTLVNEESKLEVNVKRFALNWPSITSFYALDLVPNNIRNKKIGVSYNPENCSLEWENIKMSKKGGADGVELINYQSDELYLLVSQPGELYLQDSIYGKVELEIKGLLLSGLQARFYNGIGKLDEDLHIKLTSNIIINLHLVLDDAFSRRLFSPYQQLHFDGVIPSKMRIADIRTVLDDKGFLIKQQHDLELHPDEGYKLKHFILAERAEGPDRIILWLVIQGKRYTTTRQSEVKGGQVFTSDFESGELDVYMRAQFPGNSTILTKEMNAIQTSLKDRFERLRDQR